MRKNNFFRINSKLKFHKTNSHSNLKKKGNTISLTNIIKKNSNKKTIKKEKHKLNATINSINNYDMNKSQGILGKQITPSGQKKKNLKFINIRENNRDSEEKKKVYLEKDIRATRKEKDKNEYYKKSNYMNEIKKKLLNKKLNKEIGLHSNKSESNKFYENDFYSNNRILKTENNSINIEENHKIYNNINKIKQKKNYVVDFKSNDKNIDINNKNEIIRLKDEISELKARLKELEKSLKEKDNIIKNLKNERKEMLNKNKKLNLKIII